MPKQGHISVTIKVYLWEQMNAYFKAHKTELRNKGIKSTTALVTYCLEHYSSLIEKIFEEK